MSGGPRHFGVALTCPMHIVSTTDINGSAIGSTRAGAMNFSIRFSVSASHVAFDDPNGWPSDAAAAVLVSL